MRRTKASPNRLAPRHGRERPTPVPALLEAEVLEVVVLEDGVVVATVRFLSSYVSVFSCRLQQSL